MSKERKMVKIKILIIDDEVDFCILLKDYFLRKQYEVFVANNLAQGIYLLNKMTPSIIFLDNNLPDGEGWQIAEELINKYPNMDINLMSSYRQNQSFNHISNVRIWEKPITVKALEGIFI